MGGLADGYLNQIMNQFITGVYIGIIVLIIVAMIWGILILASSKNREPKRYFDYCCECFNRFFSKV